MREEGRKGQRGCHSRAGVWPLAVRQRASVYTDTGCTRTSSMLMKPFRLRLFMSLFSSVWLSTCNGQESMVSSELSRTVVPLIALSQHWTYSPAHPGDRRTWNTLLWAMCSLEFCSDARKGASLYLESCRFCQKGLGITFPVMWKCPKAQRLPVAGQG